MVKPAVDYCAEVVSVVRDSDSPSPEQEAIRRPLLPLMLPQPAGYSPVIRNSGRISKLP